jgi:hypothetical protein
MYRKVNAKLYLWQTIANVIFGKLDHLADCAQTPHFFQDWLWTLAIIDDVRQERHYAKNVGFEK